MGAAITATSPIVNATDRLNVADVQPLGMDKLTLAPASIDKASATLARNIQSTAGPDLSSLFSAPDDYMNKAMELLQPDDQGNPPSQENILNAQRMMQAGQLIFQMISEQMKVEFDNAKTALKAAAE